MELHFNNTTLNIGVNDNSYRYRAIMGDHAITLYYSLPEHIEIPLGAWCEFQGERYTLESPENFKKNGSRNFEYTLVMESVQSKLKKYKFRNPIDHRLKFSFTAKPHEHLQMLIDNLNLRDSGWEMGQYIDAVEKPIQYNFTSCDAALQQIAETFNTEWEVVGKVIHLRKVEYNKDNSLSLSYGRGNGFKPGVGRSNFNNSKPLEVLWVQGGDRNIDASTYKSKELLLPKNQTLEYEGRTYLSDTDGYSIRRSDKPQQSFEEGGLDLSHIYPSWEHTVTAVTGEDSKWDIFAKNTTALPHNSPESLNYRNYRIKGESATVIFQSGMLVGKEFELMQDDTTLTGYVHAERKFMLVSQEIDGQVMPSQTYKPVVGDKFKVFGVTLPDTYICDSATKTGASWDMFKEAAKYLYENETPRFSFTGELDGIWAKKDWLNIGGKIKLGGYVAFSDEHFQIEPILIRIIGVKDYVNNPHSPTIELSNNTVGGSISSDLGKIEENEVVVDDLYKDSIRFTKRRWRDAVETMGMIEDLVGNLSDTVDGLQFTSPISPITVRTMSLLIGDESLQYKAPSLVVVYNNTTKVLTASSSMISHQTLGKPKILQAGNTSGGKSWISSAYTSPALTDQAKSYYLYLRASKTSLSAEPYLTETPQPFSGDSVNYNLLVGILSSEYESERSFATLFGYTEILPGRITADEMVIQADKTTIADGSGNKVAIFSGIDGGLVELTNVKVNGFFSQRFHTQTFISNDFLDLSFSYNVILKPRYVSETYSVVKLPYDSKYDGCVFKLLCMSEAGIMVVVHPDHQGVQKLYSTQPIFTTTKTNQSTSSELVVMMSDVGAYSYVELLQVTKDMIIVLKQSAATTKGMSSSTYGIDNFYE